MYFLCRNKNGVYNRTAKYMKKAVFWDVARCRNGVNRRFGGTYRLHLQGRKENIRKSAREASVRDVKGFTCGLSYIFLSTLKMEAIRSSETSVNTTSTRCHIPEDCFLHSHRHENLKSYTVAITVYNLMSGSVRVVPGRTEMGLREKLF
jgi:hypothetical protein